MRHILGLSVCAVLVLWGSAAQAQFDTAGLNSFVGTSESIEISPASPKPGELITATLNDYGAGTFGAQVTWRLNGQSIADAVNQREIQVEAGAIGEEMRLEVILSLPDGGERVIRRSITPLYLDIVIEAQTHVPEFYVGRPLPSIGSLVNATALLYDGTYAVRDLIYIWRVNRAVVEAGPIRGRNTVTFEMPQGREATLILEVYNPDGSLLAKRGVSIPSVYPSLKFYEVSALYGTKPQALPEVFSMFTNSATLVAAPYHLDRRVYNNPDMATWTIDSDDYEANNNPYQVTIQKTDTTGQSRVEFSVRDTSQLLQLARDSIRIQY